MPNRSLSLAEYPAAVVRLSCSKCGRSGQYRKAALIEQYGAATALPDLLHRIATDCPKMGPWAMIPAGRTIGIEARTKIERKPVSRRNSEYIIHE